MPRRKYTCTRILQENSSVINLINVMLILIILLIYHWLLPLPDSFFCYLSYFYESVFRQYSLLNGNFSGRLICSWRLLLHKSARGLFLFLYLNTLEVSFYAYTLIRQRYVFMLIFISARGMFLCLYLYPQEVCFMLIFISARGMFLCLCLYPQEVSFYAYN